MSVDRPLRICLLSSEVTPLAKTGGLGDVTAALARYLWRRGHDVLLFFPLYSSIDVGHYQIGPVDFIRDVPVRLGGREIRFTAGTMHLPGSELDIYPIDCRELYDRPGLYTSDGDEHLRFAMLGRAAIASCQRMGWSPDVVHCNDWHTALVPLELRTIHSWDGLFADSKTLLTIHNIGYQGIFGAAAVGDLGLGDDAHMLHQEDLEGNRLNFLKTGILYADLLSTVSPTHAREILSDEYGMGLQELLRQRGDHLIGILNGIDQEVWNPETDPLIPFHYTRDDLAGKERNKQSLLEELALSYDPAVPAVGLVSRLAHQKGIELLRQVLPDALARVDLRLVVLGSGEEQYESFFSRLQESFPARVCFYRGFNDELAHRIEAGSDIFLMPSLYEPCGLNQMYSLRYGTVPIVRKTGGLADSVEPYDPETGQGTGFVFEPATAEGLRWALDAALGTYRDRSRWRKLVRNGMARDFSWDRQIESYIEVYRRLAG